MSVKTTVKIWRNKELGKFLDSLETEEEKQAAIKTLNFFKETFPQCKQELRGELIDKSVYK